MADVIKIEHLYKSYGDVKAVQDLSFKIKEGELFAFLGVNGAGKSTTISVLCGTLKKDSGTVTINGVDIDSDEDSIKCALGVVFQSSVLDKSLTVKDNLKHRASLYGIVGESAESRIKELTELLDFKDILNRTFGKLSGGQRRKVDIARALIHRPKILILDEPTTGLDPQTRTTIWRVIEELRKNQNLTVLLTTHYMEEASDADYVVIIDGGKVVAEGTPIELKSAYSGDFLTIYQINEEQAKLLGYQYEQVVGGYRFSLPNTAVVTELILKNPQFFSDYEVVKGKMDSVFLTATGKKLRGDD